MTGRWAGKGAVLAAMLATTMPGGAQAQAGRYGAVPHVPLATGQGWTGRNWTGPEDGPDMRRLPVDMHRDAPPPRPERPMPPLRTDGPATAYHTGGHVRPYSGWTLPTYFASPMFQVRDFPAWGLAPPGPARRWVRYYDDAVLVGPGGRVDDVRYGIDWDRRGGPPAVMADRGPGPGPARLAVDDEVYDTGYEDGYADGRSDGGDRGDRADDRGIVTRHAGYAPGTTPGTTVVTTTPGTITTTTTTTEEIVYSTPRRARPVARKTWAARSSRWSK